MGALARKRKNNKHKERIRQKTVKYNKKGINHIKGTW